jgi:biotin carboxylase
LAEVVIIGVDTVIPLHKSIMNERDFLNREVTIQYLENHPHILGHS